MLHFCPVPPRAIGAAQVVLRRFQWYLRCLRRYALPHKFLLQFLPIVKATVMEGGRSMETGGRLFQYDQGVSRSTGSLCGD